MKKESRRFCIHVVELAQSDANGDFGKWDVWESFNTREEARDWLKHELDTGRFMTRKDFRIRKYVPA